MKGEQNSGYIFAFCELFSLESVKNILDDHWCYTLLLFFIETKIKVTQLLW